MNYKPISAVWEITMGCNMRCKHCGSICKEPLEDELTTDEALLLCDQIADLGLKYITLSGGEPTIRKDWHIIASALSSKNVIPNIITNGWLIDETHAKLAAEAGVGTVALSIDGLEEHHDFMRRKDSFKHSVEALQHLKAAGITTSVITTVSKKNIESLTDMKKAFIDLGIKFWQLQIALPMGSFKDRKEDTLDPCQVNQVIDFAYAAMQENSIIMDLADCLGYYNLKEVEIRKKRLNSENAYWSGCGAGITSFGILHNGDIVGCTSIREQKYIEGNIRKTPLRTIWETESNFSWSRQMTKDKLKGLCKTCTYGNYCKGGCSNTRVCTTGDIYGENKYCSYNVAVKEELKNLPSDINLLKDKLDAYLNDSNYEMALHVCKIIGEQDDSIEGLSKFALASYMTENYELCADINERLLKINKNDVYGLKGLGLALCEMNRIKEGLEYLKKSAVLSPKDYLDPYHDYILTLNRLGMVDESKQALKEAELKHTDFIKTFEEDFKDLVV